MNAHLVRVLKTEFLTHNVKRFVVEKPESYSFISGQATDVSINEPELKNEFRPFTFTSVNGSPELEFTIKIYTGHDGITEKLGQIVAGDELLIQDVFGTITYHGSGLFIAAGAGITPFISILRQLKLDQHLAGNELLFANRTSKDIILKEELREMLGENYFDIIEEEAATSSRRFIDIELLEQHVRPDQYYYICGPDKFTEIMVKSLDQLGIEQEKIIIEQ